MYSPVDVCVASKRAAKREGETERQGSGLGRGRGESAYRMGININDVVEPAFA